MVSNRTEEFNEYIKRMHCITNEKTNYVERGQTFQSIGNKIVHKLLKLSLNMSISYFNILNKVNMNIYR